MTKCAYNGVVKIKNLSDLASTPLRLDALEIMEAGLLAIDTGRVVNKKVRLEDDRFCVGVETCSLTPTTKVYLVAVGKCAYEASCELILLLGDRMTGGVVLDVSLPEKCDLGVGVKCFGGTHPIPTDVNIAATKEILKLLTDLKAEDLVIFVISGGASTLLCLPEEGYSCLDEQLILKALFRAGANIREINTIRKHMSLARGGFLAKYAHPAQVISLIFSDVPGDDIEFVASGPTVLDSTTISDADTILAKYGILQACDIEHCGLIETPKDNKYFKRVNNILFVTNELALVAMKKVAEQMGYKVVAWESQMTGEAREVGSALALKLNESPSGSVFLYGGETTVSIKGKGRGGRNKELCLAALPYLGENAVVVSVNTDGHDNGESAGAIADSEIKSKAVGLGLNIETYLENNDSEEFFKKAEGLVVTGDTGSNVSDLVVGVQAR